MTQDLNVIFENEDLLVIDKPAPLLVFSKTKTKEKTLANLLLEKNPFFGQVGEPPRYGIVHRLDKETSGIVLAAKNQKTLEFLQKEFKEKRATKKYLALVAGRVQTKEGKIETLIARDPKNGKKRKAFLLFSPDAKKQGKRLAQTYYRVLKLFSEGKNYYTLLEIVPKTGRTHQIRVHLAFLGHPIAGDKLYAFKNQPCPKDLNRQFLHAGYLKINFPDGKTKEFESKLSRDLENILNNLKEQYDE